MDEPPKTLKTSILVLTITLTSLAALLLLQFLFIYKDDLSKNGLELFYILKLLGLVVLSLIPLILPFTFSITAAANSHSFFNHVGNSFSDYLRRTVPIVLVCIILCFIYKAYILPSININKMVLLYDIRTKQPNEPMQHSDAALFKSFYDGKNYSELNGYIDTVELRPAFNKKELIDEISTYASKNEIKKLLETEQAKRIGLSVNDFNGAGKDSINANEAIIDKHFRNLLDMADNELITKEANVSRALNTKYEMILFPFLIFFMIYTGIFFGIIMRKIKPFIYVELILLFTYLPFQFFISTFSYNLIKNQKVSVIGGQLGYIGIMALIAIILGIITVFSLSKENKVIE